MSSVSRYRRTLQLGFWAVLWFGLSFAGIGAETSAQDAGSASSAALQREAFDQQFAAELIQLAAKCEELGLKEQAATTRDWFVPRHHRRQYLFLPTAKDVTAPSKAAPLRVQQWYAKFSELRSAQADRLFELAQANVASEPATAYQLLHEVLRETPDHAEARRALGYTKGTGKDWLPRPATWRAEAGRTDHPRFDWRRGQYWRVETPHYSIVTNRSAKAGLELAAELETLVGIWKQVFFDFWADSSLLTNNTSGRPDRIVPTPKMQVVLFKDRDEYLATLGPSQPQIAVSLGLYLDTQKTAYFYAADPAPRSTWLHEATHQLFQELGRHKSGVGERQNFWIVEGAAMYLESLTEQDGYWTVGGWEAERLQPARYRALSGDFYTPLENLVLLGREDLQQDADIRKLYTQAAGLTHFLMDGQNGQYRRATVDYLRSIYQQTDGPQSLTAATNTSLGELDKQYFAFLKLSDDDLANTPGLAQVTQLSLGRTDVTDEGLKNLAPCTKLLWLDVSNTKTSDEGLKNVAGAAGLQQLFLEGTQVTEASLPLIGKLEELQELDLARLPIGDEGLAHLSRLKQLRSLYLTGSPVTDAGLSHLKSLRQLESIDLRGTQVTADGVRALKAGKPKLQVEGP